MARPPLVAVSGLHHGPDEITKAALLAWGRYRLGQSDHWAAGICYRWRSWDAGQGLVTMWIPGEMVKQLAGHGYREVPKMHLDGPPGEWPVLEPRYPDVPSGTLPCQHRIFEG